MRALLPCLPWLMVLACGCGPENKTALVPDSPFTGPVVKTPPITPVSYSPEHLAAAGRVDQLGGRILAANPNLGLKPRFMTVGGPQPEVFHRGSAEVIVTEGLVQQCTTEEQLAAVLCNELGQMVADREALATATTRAPHREPPQEVRIGSDRGADLTRLAELAPYDRERRATMSPPPPPNPQALARNYLKATGFAPTALDGVAPLLQKASTNKTIAGQLTSQTQPAQWTK